MSTDPTQPLRAPDPPPRAPEAPEADAPAAPPTVPTPAVEASAQPAAPARPGTQRSQEPPTQAVPAWQAPPPPPPPGPRRPQPSQSRQPQPRQPQPQPAQPQPAEPWQQPQPQPAESWQQPQPQPAEPWQQPQPQPAEPWSGPPPRVRRRRRKRRVRRSFMALFTVIVLLILLVIGDRVALAITENDMASQFTQNGFPVKPSVSIEGFPFLTQLAAKDFRKVDISASNVPAGPVEITSINATLDGMHFSSFSSSASARVDRLDATAFISFGALAAAGGIGNGSGITVTPAGPNTVKISANLGGIFKDSEKAQITTTGPQTISVKVLPGNGAVSSLLSSFGSFSFSLPKGVPASLRITKLDLNSQGLTVSASATNATFSK